MEPKIDLNKDFHSEETKNDEHFTKNHFKVNRNLKFTFKGKTLFRKINTIWSLNDPKTENLAWEEEYYDL